ncbi:MAG: hypothetical protein IJP70_07905 [Bacteroidales bacterium]|nr:hypothetical protein [Bacteroidales bacterium]
MKKIILFPIAALAAVCFILSSCGTNENAIAGLTNLKHKSGRQEAIATIIADGLSAITGDSTLYLTGCWAYTDNAGTYDTLWFYPDSTITSHFVSKKDTINLLQTGGYLYYSSYKQALVQYNGAHNYLTKKDLANWSMTYIYGVKKFKSSLLNINSLTFSELDQKTGEVISQTTYSYVGEAK